MASFAKVSAAIASLTDAGSTKGASRQAIKKALGLEIPSVRVNNTLKAAVASGKLIQVKGSYRLPKASAARARGRTQQDKPAIEAVGAPAHDGNLGDDGLVPGGDDDGDYSSGEDLPDDNDHLYNGIEWYPRPVQTQKDPPSEDETSEDEASEDDNESGEPLYLYTAEDNETLKLIGAKFGIPAERLLELNRPRINGLRTVNQKMQEGTSIVTPARNQDVQEGASAVYPAPNGHGHGHASGVLAAEAAWARVRSSGDYYSDDDGSFYNYQSNPAGYDVCVGGYTQWGRG